MGDRQLRGNTMITKHSVHQALWGLRGIYGYSNVKVVVILSTNGNLVEERVVIQCFEKYFDIYTNRYQLTSQGKPIVPEVQKSSLARGYTISQEFQRVLKIVKERVDYFKGCQYEVLTSNFYQDQKKGATGFSGVKHVGTSARWGTQYREKSLAQDSVFVCCQCGAPSNDFDLEECRCGGGFIYR